jgi:glycosyltransferase involved in cell wall biosynthesis
LVGIPVARLLFRGVYSGVWVPGKKQSDYARLLGFEKEQIFTGFYSTDVNKYKQMWEQTRDDKFKKFPKVFLCVARYIPQKGLNHMWQAFKELCEEMDHPWELWCAGVGEGYDTRIEHPRIKHLGFVQPEQFNEIVSNTGVFILPSLFEPWGVVVNEFAAAGFPMLLSNKVGSASVFLENSVNGFLFKPGNKEAIKAAMRRMILNPENSLYQMAERSYQKGMAYSAEKWSESLVALSALKSKNIKGS